MSPPDNKRPAVDAEVAARIFKQHFGKRPTASKRIVGGLTNHVFEADVGREHLIIRISEDPAKLQMFMKEQWAIRQARKKNVPTAEVLEVANDPQGLAYMISRRVPGRPGTGGRDKAALLNALGNYAAII